MAEQLANLAKSDEGVVYSTDEIKIGKVVINGVEKDLYRRMFYNVITIDASSLTQMYAHNITGITEMFSCLIHLNYADGTNFLTLPHYWSNGNWTTAGQDMCMGFADKDYLYLQKMKTSSQSGKKVTYVVEYTKS